MFKLILIATDGTPLSQKAVAHGIGLAQTLKAGVCFVHVRMPWQPLLIPTYPFPVLSDEDRVTHEQNSSSAAQAVIDAALAQAREAGVSADSRIPLSDEPWRAIIEAGRDAEADLIVMASHGRRGLDALLLGSETQKVLAHADRPVMVIR